MAACGSYLCLSTGSSLADIIIIITAAAATSSSGGRASLSLKAFTASGDVSATYGNCCKLFIYLCMRCHKMSLPPLPATVTTSATATAALRVLSPDYVCLFISAGNTRRGSHIGRQMLTRCSLQSSCAYEYQLWRPNYCRAGLEGNQGNLSANHVWARE